MHQRMSNLWVMFHILVMLVLAYIAFGGITSYLYQSRFDPPMYQPWLGDKSESAHDLRQLIIDSNLPIDESRRLDGVLLEMDGSARNYSALYRSEWDDHMRVSIIHGVLAIILLLFQLTALALHCRAQRKSLTSRRSQPALPQS